MVLKKYGRLDRDFGANEENAKPATVPVFPNFSDRFN
jgi:hypothetical protein